LIYHKEGERYYRHRGISRRLVAVNTFDRVAGEYGEKSLLQRQAAGKLYDLLELRGDESILDVACGPGHITHRLAEATTGRVVGTDISQSMIDEAGSLYPDIQFRCLAAEDLDYSREFDVVFCNSALQWFGDAPRAMRAMFNSLNSLGKAGVCCPATYEFAPWFGTIIMAAARRPAIGQVFQHWRSPWFQLQAVSDYQALFEDSGFKTAYIQLDHEVDDLSVEEAYGLFDTGAAQGFVGRDCYDIEIGDDYIEAFGRAVRQEMENAASGGRVEVDFNRLYYIGLRR
jgi:trans-aconitate methyltransferase